MHSISCCVAHVLSANVIGWLDAWMAGWLDGWIHGWWHGWRLALQSSLVHKARWHPLLLARFYASNFNGFYANRGVFTVRARYLRWWSSQLHSVLWWSFLNDVFRCSHSWVCICILLIFQNFISHYFNQCKADGIWKFNVEVPSWLYSKSPCLWIVSHPTPTRLQV